MKRAISIAVCMAVSVSVFVQSSAFAEEPVFSGEKESYIVLTETRKKTERKFSRSSTVKFFSVMKL